MQLRILGPLELWRDGRLVALAPKQRVVLAALGLRANQVAPADWLITQLWGEEPPATATKTLHSLVLRLRRVLPAGTLVTRPPGYLLQATSEQLDLLEFRQVTRDATAAAASGEFGRAAQWWRRALGLWRGPALAGVDSQGLHRDEVPRLEELRLAALEACIDAELRLGRHGELVAELSGIVAAFPLRERFWAQMMLALYRSGRQAEALAVYARARGRLVEELGIEPGAELQGLQRQILAADSTWRRRHGSRWLSLPAAAATPGRCPGSYPPMSPRSPAASRSWPGWTRRWLPRGRPGRW
jgi:DNA-binding SARP family transcriptional activator